MTLPGASTDPEDIEVGCTVWSRTHQDSRGFVGGCVIDVDPIARTVDVMNGCTPRGGPDKRTLAIDELDHALMAFDTRNAGIVAGNLFAWLGNAKGTDRSRRNAEWGALAVRLQSIKDSGSLTPDAESRYRVELAEKFGR